MYQHKDVLEWLWRPAIVDRPKIHDPKGLEFHVANPPDWPKVSVNDHPYAYSQASRRIVFPAKQSLFTARPAGFEPATGGLEVRCSVP